MSNYVRCQSCDLEYEYDSHTHTKAECEREQLKSSAHESSSDLADLRALVIALAPRCHQCVLPALVADAFGHPLCDVEHKPDERGRADLPHAEALRRVLGVAS